jgi:hypothetical protein
LVGDRWQQQRPLPLPLLLLCRSRAAGGGWSDRRQHVVLLDCLAQDRFEQAHEGSLPQPLIFLPPRLLPLVQLGGVPQPHRCVDSRRRRQRPLPTHACELPPPREAEPRDGGLGLLTAAQQEEQILRRFDPRRRHRSYRTASSQPHSSADQPHALGHAIIFHEVIYSFAPPDFEDC